MQNPYTYNTYYNYYKTGYVPQELQNLLESDVIKLGVGIRQDFQKLEDDFPYVKPQNYVDLAVVAAAYGMSEGGLKAM
jgi:hypothetical protein